MATGKEVLRLAKEHLKRRESFAVETTLSGENYIGTDSVEINLARIAKRVRAGGHKVPEMDVRRRYLRSLQNLPVAASIANADPSTALRFGPTARRGRRDDNCERSAVEKHFQERSAELQIPRLRSG
jgi:predicted ABC-type ATPase